MNKQQPLVSVIIPVYNGCPYVGKAIQSILDQSYKRIELLIVDNGSTDDTPNVLQSFRKRFANRIKVYSFTSNKGAFFASNFALSKAKGRYIAMMDADDISQVHRIRTQVDYLVQNPRTIVLGTQATIINKVGKVIGKKSMPTTHEHILKQFAVVNPIVHPSVMYNRSLLPNPTSLYSIKYGVNDDYYTFFKLMAYGEFANLPEVLLKYRVHNANSSLQHLKQHFWAITKIRIEAITKLNYSAPILAFPIMALQTILVSILPENVLRELFYVIRGIKKISFTIPKFTIPIVIQEKLKTYAATFLA